MINITVSDVLRECMGTLICGEESLVLNHFSKDTRTLKPNDVYLGIKGENFDGNSFYEEALEKGASCCILDHFDISSFSKEKYKEATIIVVEDTILAIQKLASFKREQLNIPVIAITGSAGKTSTKDMMASVLSQKYRVFKSPGNLNGQIGLPLNILAFQDEEIMILEMGMNELSQISTLSNIAKPTIGVITNIGTAHIGILGSRENILKAKLELLDGMALNSDLIINQDNDLLSQTSFLDYCVHRCGKDNSSEYRVFDIQLKDNQSTFMVSYHQKEYKFSIPIMSNIFVSNSIFAIAAGDLLGLSEEEIQKGLSSVSITSNRMEKFFLKNDITVIDDTYNSNYEAIESALETLKEEVGKRKIAVLGDVLEMNEYAKEMHQKIGHITHLKEMDAIFLTGESSFYIMEGAKEQGISSNQIFYFDSIEKLIDSLFTFLKEGDTVLVKASNGMNFQKIVDKLKESYNE